MSGAEASKPAAEAEQAVARTWLGMTLLRATVLLGMIVAYVVAVGTIFTTFGDTYAKFSRQTPLLFWTLIVLPLLFIAAFSVGPELWRLWRKERRGKLALAFDAAAPIAGYFRLDPYDVGTPEQFRRADGAHERTLRWIEAAPGPILFLSGASGTGKSSLVQAYVLPMLERTGWRIVPIRSFGNPLGELQAALDSPRKRGSRLLVVFDQFEEFVILEGRAESAAGQAFVARVRELRAEPPPGVLLLFVLRSDYLKAVIELGLDDLDSGRNWDEIDPFKRPAARAFLEASPRKPTPELTDQLLDGAEAFEEARGLFRPITLNMLGLLLETFDRQVTRRPQRLLREYLTSALRQPDIEDVAPRVVAALITEAGTKRPRTVPELVADTGLTSADIKLCLLRLAARGLVRPLDDARQLWEIAHDFIAKQLALVLGRLRPSWWRTAALTSLPVLFTITLISLAALPFMQKWAIFNAKEALGKANIAVTTHQEGIFSINAPMELDQAGLEARLADLRIISSTGMIQLDLSGTQVADLAPLRGLTSLRQLDLSGTRVVDLAPLQGLTSLQQLVLSGTAVRDDDPILAALKARGVAIYR